MPCNYKDYPPDWKEIRARILERAGHKCEKCRVPNHTYIIRHKPGVEWETSYESYAGEETWIVLTVAHLDHDLKNNADANLLALCQLCHNRHDVANRVFNRKYGHSREELPNMRECTGVCETKTRNPEYPEEWF